MIVNKFLLQTTRYFLIWTIFLSFLVLITQCGLPCTQQCMKMEYFHCQVCFERCPRKDSDKFQFKTCKKHNCQGSQSCEIDLLTEVQCTQQCCSQANFSKFTADSINECTQVNTNDILRWRAVVFTIAGIMTTFFFLLSLYCFYSRCKKSPCHQFIHKFFSSKLIFEDNDHHPQLSRQMIFQKQKRSRQILSLKALGQIKILEKVQKQCPICLQIQTTCRTNCQHEFHIQCLKQWIVRNDVCPMCMSKNFNPVKRFHQTSKEKSQINEEIKLKALQDFQSRIELQDKKVNFQAN